MARIEKGDDLLEDILIPGWKISDDGFGLHTLSATFKADASLGFEFVRGDPFPLAEYNYCKLHKQTTSFDALGIATTVAEYVGVDPDVNSGSYTKPQLTTAGGVTTEKIETIPNFTNDFSGAPELNLAGAPPYTSSTLGPLVPIKDNTNLTTTGNVVLTKQNSYIGENGACFENATGGKFLGFVDPQFEYFYGKTSYLAPQQTFSGFIYVTDNTTPKKFLDNVGTSSSTGTWGADVPLIMPDYLPAPFTDPNNDYPQLLLTQANIESYGDLYKVTFEIKYSLNGWHPAVYHDSDSE